MESNLSGRDKASSSLFFLGIAGLVVATGMALYCIFGLRPKLQAVTDEVLAGTQEAEELTSAMQAHTMRLSRAIDELDGRANAIKELPRALFRLDDVLLEASSASKAGGKAAQETTKGVRGLVVPKEEVEQSGAALKQTGHRMRLLAESVKGLAVSTQSLVGPSGAISKELSEIQRQLTSPQGPFVRASSRAAGLREAIANAALPEHAMLLGIALSGIFAFLGVLCLSLSFALGPVPNVRLPGLVSSRPLPS